MASDLLSIAFSGARAARGALDVTAQNIANASSDGYTRRSLRLEEVSATGGAGRVGDISLSGARIAAIRRNADPFLQGEVRRTGGDLARANVELNGLRNMESALEQSGVYDAMVEFEASLQQLAGDPVDPARRAAVLGEAETLASKFNITATGFDAVRDGLQFDAEAEVSEANIIGQEIARINVRMNRAGPGTSDRASLLDQRDLMLERLSGLTAIGTSFGADGTVAITIGGQSFVQGGAATKLVSDKAADGTMTFAIQSGNPASEVAVNPGSGSLGGASLALAALRDTRVRLDELAANFAGSLNDAQENGLDLRGEPGKPFFGGDNTGVINASTIRVALTQGADIATAPVNSQPGSRDASNLDAMRQALKNPDQIQSMSSLIFDVSSKVAGRTVTQNALDTIASTARISLEQQAGVDLDTEAANLIRFQQAFQASGRAMQTASDIFDTLLGIGR